MCFDTPVPVLQGFVPTEGSLSQRLVNLQVINGEGEFREFDIDTNTEQFDIFRSHLGLCGIVIRMTFRVRRLLCKPKLFYD